MNSSRISAALAAFVVAVLASACTAGTEVRDGQTAVESIDGSTSTQTSVAPVQTPPPSTAPAPTEPPLTEPPPTLARRSDPIADLVAVMTIEEKVGQLLVPVMAGTSTEEVTPGQAANNQRLGGQDTMAALIATYHLGGVIYLGPNVVDAGQLTALSAGLQAANDATNAHGIGLFVSVDQEGGRVARITDGVTPIPPARDLAPDDRAVRASSFASAQELRRQGINVVFAPVADLVPAEGPDANRGVIGDRSYSADPEVAAAMVRAAVQGLQSGGVAAVAKHWPGHGATSVDSHVRLPTVDVDASTWRQRELVPFLAAMDVDVDMIMVGHLSLPQIDPSGVSSSISPVIVQQLLRDELGYDGVVITDALDMGAVSEVDRGELAVRTIEAGVDVLLAMPDIAAAHGALVEAVSSGRISEQRLDESVRRILELKAELRLLP